MRLPSLILLVILSFISPLESVRICGPHFLSLGPEAYYMKRSKQGGSWQDGWLYGIRGNYEKLRSTGLYFSADGYWATGELEGKSKSGNTLKSDISEYQAEGRLGFSITFPESCCVTWVPYAGYGYFSSDIDFVSPSTLEYKSTSSFWYFASGGMLLVSINDCWNAGVHFKYKLPDEPKHTIENDPDYGKLVLSIGRKALYEIELPVRYRTCLSGRQVGLIFTPFYRFRRYDSQANYPFDFYDTRFHIWGARLLFQVIL